MPRIFLIALPCLPFVANATQGLSSQQSSPAITFSQTEIECRSKYQGPYSPKTKRECSRMVTATISLTLTFALIYLVLRCFDAVRSKNATIYGSSPRNLASGGEAPCLVCLCRQSDRAKRVSLTVLLRLIHQRIESPGALI